MISRQGFSKYFYVNLDADLEYTKKLIYQQDFDIVRSPACESEAAATAKFPFRTLTRRMHLDFFFLPLFDNATVSVLYAICGKATWLFAGKTGRQLCTPSLLPPSFPSLNALSFLFFLQWSKCLVFFFTLSRMISTGDTRSFKAY